MELQGSSSVLSMPIDASMIQRGNFPRDFIFGASTSALQIEGGAREGGRGPSIWDTFTERNPGAIKDGSNVEVTDNSYNLYEIDVRMLKLMGLDAYRFSISWSRILPSGNISAGVNHEGIKYYNNLINELLANGIEPFITLFHWDLPQALQDRYGGFLSDKIVKDFCEYVELCFWEFGDRVKHWITLNEPRSYSRFCGIVYGTGDSPLSQQGRDDEVVLPPTLPSRIVSKTPDNPDKYVVGHNLLLAHAAAVELYRNKFQKSQQGKIGITLMTVWLEALDTHLASDQEATRRAREFMFGWFMGPLTTGDYPDVMRLYLGSRLPHFLPEQSKQLKGSCDFLGINYYTSMYVTSTAPKPNDHVTTYDPDAQVYYTYKRHGVPIGKKAASDWLYIYPKGIYDALVHIKKNYNDPLIYITENGVDEENDKSLRLVEARVDPIRTAYIQDHLFYLRRAMNDGVNVKGYFVWSLLDNWETTYGFTVRFGLIHINYKDNLSRYPKDSAIWFMNSFHKKNHKYWSKKRSMEENIEEEYGPMKKLRDQ